MQFQKLSLLLLLSSVPALFAMEERNIQDLSVSTITRTIGQLTEIKAAKEKEQESILLSATKQKEEERQQRETLLTDFIKTHKRKKENKKAVIKKEIAAEKEKKSERNNKLNALLQQSRENSRAYAMYCASVETADKQTAKEAIQKELAVLSTLRAEIVKAQPDHAVNLAKYKQKADASYAREKAGSSSWTSTLTFGLIK